MKNKKKIIKIGVLSLLILSVLLIPVFAGTWVQDAKGWWYKNDDNTYPANGWSWIDSNSDGISECYYFTDEGYMLSDTTTPDGYKVNAAGQWVVDGEVQHKCDTGCFSQGALLLKGENFKGFVKTGTSNGLTVYKKNFNTDNEVVMTCSTGAFVGEASSIIPKIQAGLEEYKSSFTQSATTNGTVVNGTTWYGIEGKTADGNYTTILYGINVNSLFQIAIASKNADYKTLDVMSAMSVWR